MSRFNNRRSCPISKSAVSIPFQKRRFRPTSKAVVLSRIQNTQVRDKQAQRTRNPKIPKIELDTKRLHHANQINNTVVSVKVSRYFQLPNFIDIAKY